MVVLDKAFFAFQIAVIALSYALSFEQIDCAVVGVADEEWGERVCLAAELNSGSTVELGELRTWAAERLAPYKIPRSLRCVDSLPRNAMGMVTKSDVGNLFAEDDHP